jgi:hypothetical protein
MEGGEEGREGKREEGGEKRRGGEGKKEKRGKLRHYIYITNKNKLII